MESCVALPPWSRTFLRLTSMDGRSRTSCASRHLHVQVQWRKCKGIVGRFCASRQLLPALLCLPTSLSVACARGISASLHVRTILALYIALPLGLGCLAPYAEPNADRDEGRPEGVRERDLARPPAGTGCPFGGPAEATEAVRVPFRVKARAKMLLGTFGETKVPRPPGRDPAYLYLIPQRIIQHAQNQPRPTQ